MHEFKAACLSVLASYGFMTQGLNSDSFETTSEALEIYSPTNSKKNFLI